MASYAAVASLLELLEDIIHRNRYPKLLLDRQGVFESLFEKFSSVQGLWEDCSSKGNRAAADRVERRIREVAHQAQDIIEFEIWNQINSESGGTHRLIVRIFHQLISTCQNASVRPDECEEELREVQQKVDSIVEELELLTMEESRPHGDFQSISHSRAGFPGFRATPLWRKDHIVKIEGIMYRILYLLTEGHELQIMSIVGMAGLGKTTLARYICDLPLIRDHFDCLIWVTISQHYRINEVLQSILLSIEGRIAQPHGEDNDALKDRIYKSLKGKRYLVVMDDVWSTDVWKDVGDIFPNNARSRLLLTTQLSNVANELSTSKHNFKMSFLSEDQSWVLLEQIVFGRELCPPELENIGKFIANKCERLPLAICAIANILSRTERTLECWEMIAKDIFSILITEDETLLEILSRSYNNLSHHLKACFLYMGIFPRRCEIKASKLIKLWIVEGFLKSVGGSKTLTQVAEDCLKDLVHRNLIIVTKERANGDCKYCKMHPLMRSFCGQKVIDEGFFHVMQKEGHMFTGRVEEEHPINLYKPSPYESHGQNFNKLVRSILTLGETGGSNFDTTELHEFKLLRVLGVATTLPIPDAILKMFHLKYLQLYLEGHEPGACLSPSISALQNLQTLIISSPSLHSIALPPQIWKMTQLNHLIICTMILPPISTVSGIPIHKLDCLETLMTVDNFKFTNDAIKVIPNLRKLKMRCTRSEDSGIWELYCLDNLVRLHQLEELKITVDATWFSGHGSVWSVFVFPLKLGKLSLEGCKLSWDEMAVVAGLPNLQVLRLRKNSFVGEEWKPKKGEFLRLKFLLMERLDLNHWRAEEVHFPCLEHLKINKCYQLEEIPLAIGDIETLELIDVCKSKSAADSAREILEDQYDSRNYMLQVRIID